ncbi:HNH endonuclease [Stenotrophomonas maltophilia]|uniref:HNH endonuclease n=1 Tax=Stenotrophomonas maltophilia TaxID=40324 RepID=UPI00195315C7|nr:HNH endonuclease [Stenotrophomonas maltophilia]
MQNISHVLGQAGEPWLPGLRPAANVGAKVERQLAGLLALPNAAPTSVSRPTMELLEQEAKAAEASGGFSPPDQVDERHRVLAAIVRRRGQPAFRRALLDAYGGRCAMTGCDVPDALEAAHIQPYSGLKSNDVRNGLLLRADVHTLFDLYLVTINPGSLRIALSPALQHSTYFDLDGRELRIPMPSELSACQESLTWHRSQCQW